MEATSKDLQVRTKAILDAAVRGEDVVITYHGEPYVKITAVNKQIQLQHESPSFGSPHASEKELSFCGMWQDKANITSEEDIRNSVRAMRKGRAF